MSTTTTRPDQAANASRKQPRDLRRLWRFVLAGVVPVPWLALAAQILLSPYAVNAPVRDVLDGVAGDTGREQLAVWAGMLFTWTVIPALFALGWVSRRRAPWLSLAGSAVALVGFTVGFHLPGAGEAAIVTAQNRLDPAKVIAISDAVWAQPLVTVSLVVFLSATSVGLLLLGAALWRSRVGLRWASVALAVSVPLHLLGVGGTAGVAGSWLLTAVGCLGVSRALVTMGDNDFDLAPNGDTASVPKEPEHRLDARTGWRILLAAGAPWVAVYVALGRFTLPYDMSDAPQAIFAAMVAHPTYQSLTGWFGLLLAPTIVSGVVAVAWLSRRGSPVLTTIGLVLSYLGFVCLGSGNGFGDLIAQALATHPQLDGQTAYTLGFGLESSPASSLSGLVFVLGHLIGTVILGVAVWRSRAVPSWIAIILAVSQPIHLLSVMIDNRPLDLVGWGGTALGFAAAGWALLRMDNRDFDLDPESVPVMTADL
jgi:hypothetical protein